MPGLVQTQRSSRADALPRPRGGHATLPWLRTRGGARGRARRGVVRPASAWVFSISSPRDDDDPRHGDDALRRHRRGGARRSGILRAPSPGHDGQRQRACPPIWSRRPVPRLMRARAHETLAQGVRVGAIGSSTCRRFALSCTRRAPRSVTQLAKLRDLLDAHPFQRERGRAHRRDDATGRSRCSTCSIRASRRARDIAHASTRRCGDRDPETTKTSVAHCPLVQPEARVRHRGRSRGCGARASPSGIGADGAACNNRLDGFEEIRLATLLAARRERKWER